MTYFHVFWTKPCLPDPRTAATEEIEFWDFEALTWLVSALEARRMGLIRLVTDSRGLLFARRTGLEWVYNGGISTVLDEIPAVVDPRVFWAAGKLYAYRTIDSPCVGIDTDAILWRPLEPTGPVMALHVENKAWPFYQMSPGDFARYGFNPADWNWSLHPFNAGIVYFGQDEPRRFYADTAIRFMEAHGRTTPPTAGQGCDPMVFAEQRLLPMCMERLQVEVKPIAWLDPTGGHLARNATCTHLWGAKSAYKLNAEARRAYVGFLIDRVRSRHPEALRTLAEWKLDRARPHAPAPGPPSCAMSSAELESARFSLLRKVHGVVWIEDPNVDVRRRATEGSLVWAPERIRPEPGASFELVVAGKDAVSIRQTE